MSEIDDIESLDDLKLEITNRIVEWRKNPIPKVYDDHFKLHPNSVQFGLDIALNLVTATIEELQNRNDELNEDGTYGYE